MAIDLIDLRFQPPICDHPHEMFGMSLTWFIPNVPLMYPMLVGKSENSGKIIYLWSFIGIEGCNGSITLVI